MAKIHIDFNHPYAEYLRMWDVPVEKHAEFYERFGYYMYSKSTPESEKQEAFKWMMRHSAKLTGAASSTVGAAVEDADSNHR
jgi:hypothetical protein